MKTHLLLLLTTSSLLSCNSSVNKIFGGKEKSPHEVYAATIDNHPARTQWLEASTNSLLNAHPISLPYRQHGYFPADKPRALALQFNAKRGEQINFELPGSNATTPVIYADVFTLDGTAVASLVADHKENPGFSFDVEETGSYILRLQPEIESNGQYSLSISVSPSLGFPVAGMKARVGSVWGDSRDKGVRKHEGIDIFAARLTPAIAAADGYISSVKDGGLGGKTVNLKVEVRNLSLYYAHLDKQLVHEGQNVKKGDTLGLVGSTGNAKATSPHLHFGIYTYGGAIDPLPFVNKTLKTAPAPATKDLTRHLQLLKPVVVKDKEAVKANTVLIPLAITATGYLAELADGTIVQAPFKYVKVSGNEN